MEQTKTANHPLREALLPRKKKSAQKVNPHAFVDSIRNKGGK